MKVLFMSALALAISGGYGGRREAIPTPDPPQFPGSKKRKTKNKTAKQSRKRNRR